MATTPNNPKVIQPRSLTLRGGALFFGAGEAPGVVCDCPPSRPAVSSAMLAPTAARSRALPTHARLEVLRDGRLGLLPARLVAQLGDGAACGELVACVVRRHGGRLPIARFLQFHKAGAGGCERLRGADPERVPGHAPGNASIGGALGDDRPD